ncbi:MAG TPA: hypothetical protein VJ965_00250 [Anaerolineales bacterium]|nr:hypothetical protein [Anaerolineales bacterium]
MSPITVRILQRIALSLLIGILFGFLISEVSFLLLQDSNRAPETVELLIPDGTAEKVSRGETPPDIPEEMTFVVGDVLLVRNEDSVDHELGPLWIPAGTSAQMALDRDQNFIFACSFQPSNYFGLDVREPVTIWTRVGGIIFAGVPMGAIIALYSFIVWPVKKEETENVPVDIQ